MLKNKSIIEAFTLIELLVVISIIGILIGLSIFGLQGARTASRDAKRKADLESIRGGLEIYKSDCNIYPAALPWGAPLSGDNSVTSCPATNTYISSVPTDPLTPTNEYSYYSPDQNAYYLCAALEQSPNPTPNPNDLSNCPVCGTGVNANCNYVVKNP